MRSRTSSAGRPGRRKRLTIAEQLRERIVKSDLTDGAIAAAAGVDRGSVGRFMRAEREWISPTAEAIFELLELDLTPGRVIGRRGRKTSSTVERDAARVAVISVERGTTIEAYTDPCVADQPTLKDEEGPREHDFI